MSATVTTEDRTDVETDHVALLMDGMKNTETSTERAAKSTMLTPRFYTTDFDAMDRLDVSPVRAEWDKMMDEFRADSNTDHFQRPPEMVGNFSRLEPALHKEFLDFLISSCTSEFSGCVLYAEIKKKVNNPDIKELMSLMARDEVPQVEISASAEAPPSLSTLPSMTQRLPSCCCVDGAAVLKTRFCSCEKSELHQPLVDI